MNRSMWIAGRTLVAIATLMLWNFASPENTSATVEAVRTELLGYGDWAALASASLMLLQSVVAPIPSSVITIANGVVFGPIWGGILSWSSMLLGASLCFWLSRRIGKPFAARVVGPPLQRAEGFFKRYGLYAIFLIRLLPFVPFDAVSYAAGLVGVPYGRFLVASGIGLIPSVVIYSYFGPIVVTNHLWLLPLGLCVTVVLALVGPKLLQRGN